MRTRRKSFYSTTREERIEHIARLMRAGSWKRGDAAELSSLWGVPLYVAEHAAGEAAIVLRVSQRLFADDVKADVIRRIGAFLAA